MVIRHTELKKIEQLYDENGNQLVVLYGREGCDKEAFIRMFCKERNFSITGHAGLPSRSSACSLRVKLKSSMT